MPKTIETSEFSSEEEEALWWDNDQTLVLGEFEQAARNGTLGRGTLARRGQISTTTIRLDPTNIELAKVQAERRGVRYQAYLKMIIHQALLHEAESTASTRTTLSVPKHRNGASGARNMLFRTA